MLSTPDLRELPEKFKAYFGRMINFSHTGHFYDVAVEPVEVAADITVEQEFIVPGLLTTDVVIITKPTLQAGLAVVGGRVPVAGTLAVTYMNCTAGAITPSTESYVVVTIRREKE